MRRRVTQEIKKIKEINSTYTVNEADSLTNHHSNRPYLGCIQTLKFWVTLYPDWVDTRISLCPALDPHIVFENAPMFSPNFPWMIQRIMGGIRSIICRLEGLRFVKFF